jgi:hypothetical protein
MKAGCPGENSRLVYRPARRISLPGRLFGKLRGSAIPRAVAGTILGTVAAIAGAIARTVSAIAAAIAVAATGEQQIGIKGVNRSGAVPRAVAGTIARADAAVAGAIARAITAAIAVAGQQDIGAITEIVATMTRSGHHRR